MKKPILFILIIFCSCNNKEIEGTWIGAYRLLKSEDKKSIESLNTIIKIEDNRFYNQVLGLEKDRKLFSFEFTKSGNSIISKDSVKIRFGDFERVKNYSWSTSVTNKLIFLIEKEYAVLKILSLDNNEMTLEIGLEPNENKKRLVYRRE